jgi:hypothetical protein
VKSRRHLPRIALLCSALVMATLSSTFASPAQAHRGGSSHEHWGWAQSTVLEQFGVTATEDYVEMMYDEDCCGVYNASWWDWYAYHSSFPGWNMVEYDGYIYHNEPNWLGVEGWSGWKNSNCQCDYGQWEYYETGDGYWLYQGGLYYGSLPYFWDFRYYGGRWE